LLAAPPHCPRRRLPGSLLQVAGLTQGLQVHDAPETAPRGYRGLDAPERHDVVEMPAARHATAKSAAPAIAMPHRGPGLRPPGRDLVMPDAIRMPLSPQVLRPGPPMARGIKDRSFAPEAPAKTARRPGHRGLTMRHGTVPGFAALLPRLPGHVEFVNHLPVQPGSDDGIGRPRRAQAANTSTPAACP